MVRAVKLGRPLRGAALVLALVLAAPAAAQEPGVHVDPDSPAGKEYAVPIDQARREAEGASKAPGADAAGRAAPLFGAGISPRSGGHSGKGSDGSAAGGSGGAGKSGNGGGKDSEGFGAGNSKRAAVTTSTDTGISPTLQTVLLAAAVLLAGGLIGFVLQRLTRPRAS